MLIILEISLTKSRSLSPDALIAIFPDGAETEIMVSKAILCENSKYFVKVLDGKFKEAGERILRFPGWSAEVVELFIYWAYKSALPTITDLLARVDSKSMATRDAEITMIRLWMFGDARLVPKLQNDAMKLLVDLSGSMNTSADVIQLGYTEAPKDSALQKFVLDEARWTV